MIVRIRGKLVRCTIEEFKQLVPLSAVNVSTTVKSKPKIKRGFKVGFWTMTEVLDVKKLIEEGWKNTEISRKIKRAVGSIGHLRHQLKNGVKRINKNVKLGN